jgi:hypothetical protein
MGSMAGAMFAYHCAWTDGGLLAAVDAQRRVAAESGARARARRTFMAVRGDGRVGWG